MQWYSFGRPFTLLDMAASFCQEGAEKTPALPRFGQKTRFLRVQKRAFFVQKAPFKAV